MSVQKYYNILIFKKKIIERLQNFRILKMAYFVGNKNKMLKKSFITRKTK